MRILASSICVIVLCTAAAVAADKKPTPAEQQEAAKMARVDAMAKQAFSAADHNHNDILSKVEFANADELLGEGIMQLGAEGVLGQPPKGQGGNQAAATANKAVSAAPANLGKKNRISLSEFQLYARAMAAQADVQMAQDNSARQAYMQQMQRMRGRQRQVRTGTPIIIGY